jgi:hypothetical protein
MNCCTNSYAHAGAIWFSRITRAERPGGDCFLTSPNTFELILLCHSVPEASRVLLVALAKKLFPALPILMLYNGYEHTEAPVDGAIHNLDSPASVISMVKFLTGKTGQH